MCSSRCYIYSQQETVGLWSVIFQLDLGHSMDHFCNVPSTTYGNVCQARSCPTAPLVWEGPELGAVGHEFPAPALLGAVGTTGGCTGNVTRKEENRTSPKLSMEQQPQAGLRLSGSQDGRHSFGAAVKHVVTRENTELGCKSEKFKWHFSAFPLVMDSP